jgi:hypothetical protein
MTGTGVLDASSAVRRDRSGTRDWMDRPLTSRPGRRCVADAGCGFAFDRHPCQLPSRPQHWNLEPLVQGSSPRGLLEPQVPR